jgi:(1->4)-alpha-D-glucan 1-alpha-D-glucosylmutase
VTATYRLQLHAGFPFAAAEKVVPYLAELGVTHLYLSPVLQAVPGSMHGYDVVDHTRVSTELGGVAGLESLAAMARVHGLGIVVDTVPNHMALVAPEHLNQPLWQVLSRGRDASTASWFDIDWRLLDGRLGLPVLDGSLEQAVSTGRLTLGEYDGQRVVRYGDHVLPLAEGTDGDDVLTVLGRQHYLLAGWQDKDAVLNYRRFFDVDALMALRVEDPDVFEATHRLLLDLNHRGVVEGFRIDHPDGLADPEGYLHRLRDATRPGTAIWVEKILAPDERLPRAWACDGTTGYDAARAIKSAPLDADAAPSATPSGSWSATCSEPRPGAWSAGRSRRCPGPETAGSTRRSRSCCPPARSTAPTSASGSRSESMTGPGCSTRWPPRSSPSLTLPPSSTGWSGWRSARETARPPTTSRCGSGRPPAR